MWFVLTVSAYLADAAPIVHPSAPVAIAVPFLYHLVEPDFTPGVRTAAFPTVVIWSAAPLPLTNKEGVSTRYGDAVQFGAKTPVSL